MLWLKIKSAGDNGSRLRFFERILTLGIGGVIAATRFFYAIFWQPEGLGWSRFISACVDYMFFPLTIPIISCFIFACIKRLFFKERIEPDWTGWILLMLIPVMLVCAGRWGIEKNPANLVLIPLLWSAVAFNCSYFTSIFVKKNAALNMALFLLSALAAALFAALVWWAFFVSQTIIGFALLAIEIIPAALTVLKCCKNIRTGRKINTDKI
jgi:hypothetical protein